MGDTLVGAQSHLLQVANSIANLDSRMDLDISTLIAIWEHISKPEAKKDSKIFKIYKKLASRFLKKDEPILAYEVIDTALKHWEDEHDSLSKADLQYWQDNSHLLEDKAMALSRCGSARGANEILKNLYDRKLITINTLCFLGRTHKDFSQQTAAKKQRKEELAKSHAYYLEAFEMARNALDQAKTERRLQSLPGASEDFIYSGINAATTALLLGKKAESELLAKSVRSVCKETLTENPSDYWARAALGEAEMILGHVDTALEEYVKAKELGKANPGDIYSTWRQARMLRLFMKIGMGPFEKRFRIPKIVIFAGHMMDSPGRSGGHRFPTEITQEVRAAIDALVKEHAPCIGYCSATCGSDLLFTEAMIKHGQELHIVLPFPRAEFRRVSVENITDNPKAWLDRFDMLMEEKNATVDKHVKEYTYVKEVIETGAHVPGSEPVSFDYANKVLTGLAMLHSKKLAMPVVPLVVWDGKKTTLTGGTSSNVELWKSLGIKVDKRNIVDTNAILRKKLKTHKIQTVKSAVSKPAANGKSPPPPPQIIRAMLFADVKHYSKVDETQICEFVDTVFGGVAKLIGGIKSKSMRPLTKNTWGDAIYLVFRDARAAGLFALDLVDRLVEGPHKLTAGTSLPADLTFRIALHAGPVFKKEDKVLGKKENYTGKHVNRAARLEPITLPGHVFVSQEFAALVAAEKISEFHCEYVGHRPLPKDEGIIPTYHVMRSV